MKPNEIKIFTGATIIFSAIVWLIGIITLKAEPISIGSLKAINIAVTVTSAVWGIYFTIGWKWPYIRKLLFRPNINGTWIGEFKSDWTDENGNGVPPGRFVLVIRQTFFSVSIRAFSKKQKTNSYVESLVCDDDRGTKFLAYLYQEKRTTSVEHGARQGAAELDLVEESRQRTLEGEFWTHTGTTGFVRVKQSCTNLCVESFSEAEDKWPGTDNWANV